MSKQLIVAVGIVAIVCAAAIGQVNTAKVTMDDGREVWVVPGGPQQAAYDDRAKITVNGEAVVRVTPDKIAISLGIETRDMEIVAAKQKNNSILKSVAGSLAEMGVPASALQTDRLSIEPRYRNYQQREEEFLGYFVRNTLVVTVTDVNMVEPVVTMALQSGVNYIYGVDFQTSEFAKYREQARELALKAAREKAVKMSAVLGQRVGVPISINEGSSWSGMHSSWGRGRDTGMSQNVIQTQGPEGEVGETVALGKIAVRANVTVTFLLGERIRF